MAKNKKIKDNSSKMGLKGKSAIIFIVIVMTLLILYTLSQFYVLGWGLMTSLKSRYDFEVPVSNVLGFPDINGLSREAFWKLENYGIMLSKFDIKLNGSYYSMGNKITYKGVATIWNMIANSIIYVLIGGTLRALFPCVVAFLCSKYKYKFSKFIIGMIVVLLSIHLIGAGPASLKLYRDLGLYNNWFGQIIMHSNFLGMYFLVFVAYFDGLSDTYSEAAEIDGASQLAILIKIGLPLAMKMMVTIFLLNSVTLWNDYNTPMLYLPGKPTLSYGIYRFTNDSQLSMANVPTKMAGGMILAIPMTLIFIIFKKKLMGNVTMGGLKE